MIEQRALLILENTDKDGGFTISKQTYNLKLRGKSVCPKTFARLLTISKTTLTKVASEGVPRRFGTKKQVE